jgi:hypothetical protein
MSAGVPRPEKVMVSGLQEEEQRASFAEGFSVTLETDTAQVDLVGEDPVQLAD